MRRLILVRHSESRVDPAILPQHWVLTWEGRRRCFLLASRLAVLNPELIITSEEYKAHETGKVLADILDLECITAPDLHEHKREMVEIYGQQTWFKLIERFFTYPSELIFGLETANQARDRFSEAVHSVMEQHFGSALAVVSHGIVMSLYYQDLTGKDPFIFWRQLGLPGFYTVSWPDCEVISTVMDIL